MNQKKNDVKDVLKDKKTIVTGVLAIVIVLLLVFVVSQCNRGKKDDIDHNQGETDEFVVTVTEDSTEDPSYYDLKEEAIPALSELIHTYFEAMENKDVDQYTSIVTGDDMTAEKLEKKGEFIENYQNIVCYTKPGMTEGTYIAYVYYEVKFHNIDTLAPALIQLYVCTNEDGTMYIYAGSLDAELAAYKNAMSASEDVLALNAETEDKLEEAMAADEKLTMLIEKLREGAEYEEEETEPETEEVSVDERVFEDRDETVLTTTTVRVRSTPSAVSDDNIVGLLEAGEKVTRTGYNDRWSRIEYNGEVAYIATQYLILK